LAEKIGFTTGKKADGDVRTEKASKKTIQDAISAAD